MTILYEVALVGVDEFDDQLIFTYYVTLSGGEGEFIRD